jgi:peroxiredoxin
MADNRQIPALAISLLLGAAALGYGVYHFVQDDRAPAPPQRESALAGEVPVFEMPDPGGEIRHIDDWAGDVLVINFWGTWCAPCRDEVPVLIDIQERYGDEGLTVLGIALDQAAPVRRFAEDFGINYPLLVGEQETLQVLEQFGSTMKGLPHTFLADRDGRIVNFHVGIIEPHEVESFLAPAFNTAD